MANFGDYFLGELLKKDLPKREWLVENLLRENDSVILVGDEKSGKSLLIFQLISSLTSGQPFLDTYNTIKERKVVYIQLEGELNDSQDRFKRLQKTLDYKTENCLIMYRAPLEMQERGFTQKLAEHILTLVNTTPDVVIFDPIYFSFTGSLNNDEVVRKFIGNIRIFKDILNCSIILVHHTHKIRWGADGFMLDEGDEAMFGSKFLKAWADHILLFTYNKNQQLRALSCTTQRSGDIIKKNLLRLIEPDPLYFEITEEHIQPLKDHAIIDLLKNHTDGMTRQEVMAHLNISSPLFYKSIKAPLAQGILEKLETHRPVIFKFKGVGNENGAIAGNNLCVAGQGNRPNGSGDNPDGLHQETSNIGDDNSGGSSS